MVPAKGAEVVCHFHSATQPVIIGTGVLLSIYRDRLLTLPDRVRRREGMFRVLSWR